MAFWYRIVCELTLAFVRYGRCKFNKDIRKINFYCDKTHIYEVFIKGERDGVEDSMTEFPT